MRIGYLIIWSFLAQPLAAQFINPGFDDWDTIQIGQPYIDPVGWKTNNITTVDGFASTPVRKGMDSLGCFARVSSNAHGIDATLSGRLSQTISAAHLAEISFDCRCDTLALAGKCVVRILGQSNSNILFEDTSYMISHVFSMSTIEIHPDWITNNDSLTIQFEAKGGFDPWDEQEDGYAVFMIDNVVAEYISGTNDRSPTPEFNLYPNPATNYIHIDHGYLKEPDFIEIRTVLGQLLFKTKFSSDIDISMLPQGVYNIHLISSPEIQSKALLVRD